MGKRALFLYSLICLISLCNIKAQEVIVLSNHKASYFIGWEKIYILEDTSGSYNIDSIQGNHYTDFKPVKKLYPSNLINNWNTTYWIRLKVKATTTPTEKWVIDFEDRNMSEIEVYCKGLDGKLVSSKAGSQINYSERAYFTEPFIFDIYPDTSTQYIYFKFKSIYGTDFYSFIKSQPLITRELQVEQFVQGIYLGIILLILFFSLLMFFSLRKQVYLSYSFFIFTILFREAALNRWGFQYIWPQSGNYNSFIFELANVSFLVGFVLHANTYINNKKNFPWLYYLVSIGTIVFVIYYLLNYFLTGIFWIKPFGVYVGLQLLVCLSAALGTIKKLPYVKYFFIGTLFIPFDYLLFALHQFYILPPKTSFNYTFSIGSIIEVCLFSIALVKLIQWERKRREAALQLANKVLEDKQVLLHEKNKVLEEMNIIKEEMLTIRDKVHNEVEDQVSQRTRELYDKNNELKTRYEQMTQWNVSLDKQNWDLNKNIKELHKLKVFGSKSEEEFEMLFPDDNACLRFLSDLKWGETFYCLRCKNAKWSKSTLPYSRTCTKCGFVESPFKNTIHEGSKMPVKTGFYIIYAVYHTKGEISSAELAAKLHINEKSCRAYKKKVLERMKLKSKSLFNGWQDLILN